jgi:cation transport regulator ChaC
VLTSKYLFVYGSLIHKSSTKLLENANIPATVRGLRRGWVTTVQDDAMTGLGAVFDETRSCNGVLIEVSDEWLQSTDEREIKHGYRRVNCRSGA